MLIIHKIIKSEIYKDFIYIWSAIFPPYVKSEAKLSRIKDYIIHFILLVQKWLKIAFTLF